MRTSVIDSWTYFPTVITCFVNLQTVILVYIIIFSLRNSRLMWIQNSKEN